MQRGVEKTWIKLYDIPVLSKSSVLVLLIIFLLLISLQSNISAQIYPQFGLNSYVGPNKLFSIAPWFGLRFPVSNASSVILKFNQQQLAYEYYNWEEEKELVEKKISHLVGVYYLQKNKLDLYAAILYLIGQDKYTGLGLDAGFSYRLFPRFKVEGGIYLLSEKSNLWYPDEAVRDIKLTSVRIGIQYQVFKKLIINPKLYFSSNSEDVSASTYSLGVIYLITGPLYLTADYTRYSESQQYKFSGNYFNCGINVYF